MVAQQHRRKGGTVALAAVLGAMAVGGCSAGVSGPADGRPRLDTVQGQAGQVADGRSDEVRTAADRLIAAGSARTRTSMETAAGGTRVTIRGEGGYDFTRREGRLTVVLPKDPAGMEARRPVTELMTPGALYMKNRGAGVPADKWVRVDTTTLEDGNLVTGGATDPLAAAELLRSARNVVYLGEETLDGATVRHYRGDADIARAALAAEPHARASLAAAAKGFARDAVPFEAYLDERGRLRKVLHRFTFTNGGGTVEVASTTLLYDFGAPVVVRLPDRRDIYAGKIRG
ncbi:lipoprotein [Streptomyces amakusaensis]|uniref:Lipoprotein n=1 Tax=Streptomyces amakusaensis TaxID=67271 RepID=A0ABW0AV99_9ACTN